MRSLWIGVLAFALLAQGGCARGTVQSALGMDKRAPDEFAVVKRAPLIVPPDFDLRPPRPGATQPVNTADDRTLAALTGRPEPTAQALARAATLPANDQAANDQATSRGEQALLARVGAAEADPGIRHKIAEDQSLAEVDDAFRARLMSWQPADAAGADARPTVLERDQSPIDQLGEETP